MDEKKGVKRSSETALAVLLNIKAPRINNMQDFYGCPESRKLNQAKGICRWAESRSLDLLMALKRSCWCFDFFF